VTVIAERLLPREEPEVTELLDRIFAQEGIERIGARADSVRSEDGAVTVHTGAGDAIGDLLLVAVGRAPMVNGLGLEAAGVRYSERGIVVNEHLQTTTRHIYAAGDVIGGPQFSHLAGWQGFQAVRNALLPGKNAGTSAAMPRITFTVPEVAQIGITEEKARKQFNDDDLQIMAFDISKVDRAVNEDDRLGIIKIIARTNGTILGATIVGERAGEAITEIAVAMRNKLKLSDLASTIHPYPTYSMGIQLLVTKMAVDRALSGASGRMIRSLSTVWR
jgi:pyruvate/2-oxoglutarate dehydrogenase complex dihydrolipoamide dehydrogenase (E3) component